MREVTDPDRLMRQFLLNKLDLQERERVEEQFMLDGAFKEQLLMAEESLIEDYLDDSLDAADRARFDSVFLSSLELREKLDIAKAIRATAKAEKSGSRLRMVLRVAAALIAIIGIVWLIQRYLPGQEGATERAKRQAIQTELTRLNSSSEIASRETLVLAPVNTRSNGATTVSRKAGPVVELLLIPTSLENGNFKAMIRRDEASWQFEVSNLTLANRPQGQVVPVRIPIHLLDSGAYLVELNAMSANGELQHRGEYRFQLVD